MQKLAKYALHMHYFLNEINIFWFLEYLYWKITFWENYNNNKAISMMRGKSPPSSYIDKQI